VTLKSKNRLVLAVVSLVITLFPIICIYLASFLSTVSGCKTDESGTYPCIVGGFDIGGLLYVLGTSGWLAIITFPVGGIATIVLLIMALNSWNETEIT